MGHRRYRTVCFGAPANFAILHSKIGRRVDFARVRYGTMQSKFMRARSRMLLCLCMYIKVNNLYHWRAGEFVLSVTRAGLGRVVYFKYNFS